MAENLPNNENEEFELVISAEHKLFDFKIKETIKYRDLLFLFVKRDFFAYYKQTVLGPMWAVIQPLLTTIVFTVIFGTIAKLSTTDAITNVKIPAFLFYMAGSICWSYISTTVEAVSKTFIQNANIMGKVYYPRLITPLSSALSKLISFGIQLALFFVLLIGCIILGKTDVVLGPRLLLIPLTILQLVILSTSCGVIISSVTTKYRDLQMVVSFGLSLWQYASPIAYGLTLIKAKYLKYYMINPVSPLVTAFRYFVFGTGYFNLQYYIISWIISLVMFFIGLMLFSRIERTFMDTI